MAETITLVEGADTVTLSEGGDSITLVEGSDTITIATGLTYVVEGTVLKGNGNPNGVVTGILGQTYYDQVGDEFYRSNSDPSGTSWKLMSGGGGGAVPEMLKVTASGVAEGNNSIVGWRHKTLIKSIKVTTTSADWSLTLYESDDYATSPHTVVRGSLGKSNVEVRQDIVYEDQDATQELHYNFTDNAGSATHDIEVRGYELS